MRKNILLLFTVLLAALSANAGATPQTDADDTYVVPALFEYPVAPETLTSIGEKSDWLVMNFWNDMDFKKKAVDQTALEHAFSIWCTPMIWADRGTTLKSIDALLKKLKKNPGLLYQFVMAAEHNLYSPQANVLIDEAYMKFLDAALKEKKFPARKKARYAGHKTRLSNCLAGQPIRNLQLITADGSEFTYTPDTVPALVMFSLPDNVDCRMWKVQLDMNTLLNNLAREGKIKIYHVTTGEAVDSWLKDTADYPEQWVTACSPAAVENIDMRIAPSFYVIDAEGNIVVKNTTLEQAQMVIVDLLTSAETSSNANTEQP